MDIMIIGLGELGLAFYQASKQVPQIRIIGYHDIRPNCQAIHISYYPNLGDAISLEVDGYILAVPQNKQLELALFLAKTGRKLVLPLPWALDSNRLGAFLEKIPQQQIFVVPFDCYRKDILKLKDQLQQKILGTIGIAEFTSIAEKRPQKWYQDLNLSGGCRYQLLLPLLVVVRFLFGEIESSYGGYYHTEGMDYSNCSLKLRNGMLVSLEASWGNKERNRKTFEISGERGNISFDSIQSKSVTFASGENDNAYWDDLLDSSVPSPIALFLKDLVAEKHLVPASWLPSFYQLIENSLNAEEVFHG